MSLLLIGSDRPRKDAGKGPGLSAWDIDPADGSARLRAGHDDIDNVLSLAVDPVRALVVASGGIEGAEEGRLQAFRIDPDSRQLFAGPAVGSGGDRPAHLALDPVSHCVLATHYGLLEPPRGPGAAVASFRLAPDGGLSGPLGRIELSGTSAHKRQTRSHPHCARIFGTRPFVAVADLGTDRISVHALDRSTAAMTPVGGVALPPGSGPRHITFHPQLPLAWASCELSGEIACLRVDAATGRLELAAMVPVLPAGTGGEMLPSELCLSPDGRFLAVAVRVADRLAVLAIEPDSGLLRFTGATPTGGGWPVHAAFDPSGRFLRVANMRDGLVAAFSWDFASGTPRRYEAADIRLHRPSWLSHLPGA